MFDLRTILDFFSHTIIIVLGYKTIQYVNLIQKRAQSNDMMGIPIFGRSSTTETKSHTQKEQIGNTAEQEDLNQDVVSTKKSGTSLQWSKMDDLLQKDMFHHIFDYLDYGTLRRILLRSSNRKLVQTIYSSNAYRTYHLLLNKHRPAMIPLPYHEYAEKNAVNLFQHVKEAVMNGRKLGFTLEQLQLVPKWIQTLDTPTTFDNILIQLLQHCFKLHVIETQFVSNKVHEYVQLHLALHQLSFGYDIGQEWTSKLSQHIRTLRMDVKGLRNEQPDFLSVINCVLTTLLPQVLNQYPVEVLEFFFEKEPELQNNPSFGSTNFEQAVILASKGTKIHYHPNQWTNVNLFTQLIDKHGLQCLPYIPLNLHSNPIIRQKVEQAKQLKQQ